MTPLAYAVNNNHIDMVKLLLEAGAQAKIEDTKVPNPVFHVTAEPLTSIVLIDVYFTQILCISSVYIAGYEAVLVSSSKEQYRYPKIVTGSQGRRQRAKQCECGVHPSSTLDKHFITLSFSLGLFYLEWSDTSSACCSKGQSGDDELVGAIRSKR